MSIVAISQALGSLGDEIGREVARARGYAYADREIVLQAAERFGRRVSELEHATEERPTLWDRFTDTTRRYRAYVEAIVLQMAARDAVVISGRGAPFLLASVRHALRVRITAPERVRITRMERRLGVDTEAAADLVRQSDRERAARVRFLYHVDWDDPLLYDLVVNTDRLDTLAGVRLIQASLEAERCQPTPESLREVRDLALAAEVTAALVANPLTQPLHIAITCVDGHVSLRGAAVREEERRAAEETVSQIAGVTAVTNEIVVTSAPPYRLGV